MRWLTFRDDSGERTGVLSGDAIRSILDTGREPAGSDRATAPPDCRKRGSRHCVRRPPCALDQVTLMAPIPRPPSIRDSLCFLDHMRNCQAAMGGGRVLKDTWYRIPAFYFACPSTVLGPYDDAPMAPGSVWQDFELEIAAVIGTAGKDLSVADAERSIVGYMIFNDWSARDLQQLEGQLAIGQAKGKDSGVTLGPYLVTPDELEPYRRDGKLSLYATALVNDEVIGSGSTAQMDWSFAESHRLRLARRNAQSGRCFRLRNGADLHAGRTPRPDGAGVFPRLAARRRRRHAASGRPRRDAPDCAENRCAATTTGPAQSRCRAGGQAGESGTGKDSLHPRIA